MKIYRIIIVVAIIVGIGLVISLVIDMDNYSDFTKAQKKPEKEHQIIGRLNKNKVTGYDTIQSQIYFSFFMIDANGTEMKVLYKNIKPQDFEKLEQVVVTGKVKDKVFYADKMLLKCPSKYNNKKVPEEYYDKEYSSD